MPHIPTSNRNASHAGGATAVAQPASPLRIPTTVPHRALVQELAKRFRTNPDSPDLPLVTINRITPTSSIHMLVVWDKWKDLTIPQRGRLISDAFAAAFPNEQAVVRLPMG